MNSTRFIEISFKDIQPYAVKASEIADILTAVENLVELQVRGKHPELAKDLVMVGFTNMRSESIDLEFRSPIIDIVEPAYQEVAEAIAKREFSRLASGSQKPLETLISFTKRYDCKAELSRQNGTKTIMAVITPDIKIERPAVLIAETTVYAKVVRAGGKEPKVEIETVDGRTLFCEASVDITTKLGAKLYQVVGLLGTAQWDSDLNSIAKFSIKDVTEYERVSFKKAMDELAKATKPFYADIDDVIGHISQLRGSTNE